MPSCRDVETAAEVGGQSTKTRSFLRHLAVCITELAAGRLRACCRGAGTRTHVPPPEADQEAPNFLTNVRALLQLAGRCHNQRRTAAPAAACSAGAYRDVAAVV